MTRDPDPTGFEAIVAAWRAEGGVPEWPDEDGTDESRRRAGADPDDVDAEPTRRERPATAEDAAGTPLPSRPDAEPDGSPAVDPTSAARPHPTPPPPETDDDEHFVPPDPPPIPRMGPPLLVGLTLIALGLVLVTYPGWVGVPQVYGLPLGLVAIAAGLGWLVLRLWPDSSDDGPPPRYLDDPDDPDGGAVL